MKINIKEFFLFLAAALILSVSFVGCAKKKDVVAVISGDEISLSEFMQRIESSPPAYKKYLSSKRGQKQFLDLIVREKVVLKESKKAGISGTKEFKETLKKYEDEMRKRLLDFKENLMMELFLRRLNEKDLVPTESEIDEYYKKNIEDFRKPVEMSISHILLLDEKTAAEVVGKLKRGDSFESIASAYSSDPMSSQRGGFLGNVRKGDLAPEMEEAAKSLKIGDYSEVVKSDYGYHIVKKTGEKLLPEIKLADAQADIRRMIIKIKFDDWLKKTIAMRKVKINEDILEKATLSEQEVQ